MAVASMGATRSRVTARATHEIVDVEIKLAKLPRELDGFSIVRLSDLHVGPTIDRAFVQHVVDQSNELKPDLVALATSTRARSST